MVKKSKIQKRLDREREQHERFMELPLVPKDSYVDSEDVWHFAGGSYMPNGLYRTSDDRVVMYEGNPESRLVMD